ncbi:wax ester/triacylglycerol synthase family O-acyltransferase [Nocardioides speluncae]|uniref:wax ester/triacylglycerol synthase family O-acyltransferase n=1 Tax=Nocardioides speluncae TaxID=2670337 RepID=UPI000D6965F4|nr:wax ester/triacylglycerol synthase family O-acyltransferase [Nocardioides speluncae]
MLKVALADRMFLAAESDQTPQHVACLTTFVVPQEAGPDHLRRLVAGLRSVTTFAEPFNLKLAGRRSAPRWDRLEDAEIDLDYHFSHSALPKPGGERELGVLVSQMVSRPLDPSRPLWEVHLIEGLEGNRFGIVFKIHHALMDGAGATQRIQGMISSDPADAGVRPLWSLGPVSSGGARGRPTRHERWQSVQQGVGTVGGLGKAGLAMAKDRRKAGDPELAVPFRTSRSVLNGRIGRQRRVATQGFAFDRIKVAAKAGGVTINDVFLAICGAAVRRYLDERGELPAQGLTAGTPVNIRQEGDQSTQNAFTMTVMNLGTEIADPVERLASVSRSSKLAKQKLQGLPRPVVKLYPALFMGPFIGQNLLGTAGRRNPPFNVVVSNVPGPLATQYLAGARLEGMYPIGCLYHGVALFIAVFAASGQFSVGFTGDRDVIPHLQRLAVYAGEALEELERALSEPV